MTPSEELTTAAAGGQLSILDALTPTTIEDLWAIHYPGLTPRQAYEQHRANADRWNEAYRAVRAAAESEPASDSPGDVAARWQALARARTAAAEIRGVPAQWIDEHGLVSAPTSVCRECWQAGADETDVLNGVAVGYHTACKTALDIRCTLRSVAWAQMQGDTERAQMWERHALKSAAPSTPRSET